MKSKTIPLTASVPRAKLASRKPVGSALHVMLPCDLPEKLIMGKREDRSFKRQAAGFEIDYLGSRGEHVAHLSFNGKVSSLKLSFGPSSADSLDLSTGIELPKLISSANILPKKVSKYFQDRLSAGWNVSVFQPGEGGIPNAEVFYPGGVVTTMVVPLNLTVITRLWNTIGDAAKAGWGGFDSPETFLTTKQVAINYVLRGNESKDSVESMKSSLFLHEIFAGGIPLSPPVIERGSDSISAITIRKLQPMLIVRCWSYQLDSVLEHLCSGPFLCPRTGSDDEILLRLRDHEELASFTKRMWPTSAYRALLVLGSWFSIADQVSFWSDDRRARITLGGPLLDETEYTLDSSLVTPEGIVLGSLEASQGLETELRSIRKDVQEGYGYS